MNNPNPPRRRRWLRWLLLIPVVLLLAIGGFVYWASTPLGPETSITQIALTSDAAVSVERIGDLTVFRPTATEPTTGFIFYPGGRVHPDSYAPVLHQIAAEGYQVVLVPMPLNLAVFGLSRADEVLSKYPEITTWAIGGHSLGGAMAARYVQANPEVVKGIVFWASYPDIDLSTSRLQATMIYGTNDGVANLATIDAARSFLPAETPFVPIEGGNHAQFGSYGTQPGDNIADISASEQQAQAASATVALLSAIRQS